MHKLEDIKIWHRAMDLTVDVYNSTIEFPKEEVYGLRAQIRKSAVSIPSNISEGAGRNTNGEFKNFLGIAQGSSYELQTQVELAKRLGLMKEDKANLLLKEIDELQRMTYSFKEQLK